MTECFICVEQSADYQAHDMNIFRLRCVHFGDFSLVLEADADYEDFCVEGPVDYEWLGRLSASEYDDRANHVAYENYTDALADFLHREEKLLEMALV